MVYRTVLLYLYYLFIFASVEPVRMDSTEIKFIIDYYNQTSIFCDHTLEKIIQKENKYTALEGGEIILNATSISYIDSFSCTDLQDTNKVFIDALNPRRQITVNVTIEMGTVWNCTILSKRHDHHIKPIVTVVEQTYTVAYCFVQVHIRRIKSPQTILVNNMVVDQVRTDLSEKEVDYTVAYEYEDGDIVDVTCAAFNKPGQFTIRYHYADRLSSTGYSDFVGFCANLHSGHNNTSLICLFNEFKNEALVKISFIMRSELKRVVSLKVNGLMLRQKFEKHGQHDVNYMFAPYQQVNVECYVERPDVTLSIKEPMIKDVNNYKKYGNHSTQIVNFALVENYNMKIKCLSDFKFNNDCAGLTEIDFIQKIQLYNVCPLHIDLPPNGIVMELYESNKRRVIYYEYEEGEVLTLNCYTSTCITVHYLKFKNSEIIDRHKITKTLRLSSDHVETCYVMEKSSLKSKTGDTVYREVKVIFRRKVHTTTTSTTSKTLTPTSVASTVSDPDEPSWVTSFLFVAAGIILILVTILVVVVVIKKLCCLKSNRPQLPIPSRDPNTVFYLNQLEVCRPQEEEHSYEEM